MRLLEFHGARTRQLHLTERFSALALLTFGTGLLLVDGGVLCMVACLAALLTSAHQQPVAVMSPKSWHFYVPSHCQTSLGEVGSQITPGKQLSQELQWEKAKERKKIRLWRGKGSPFSDSWCPGHSQIGDWLLPLTSDPLESSKSIHVPILPEPSLWLSSVFTL